MSDVISFAESASVRDEQRRHAADVRGEARGDELHDEFLRGHEHFAAHVAALLCGGELIFEVHARGACFDHRLHQLVRVQRPAETGLRVRDDRRVPIRAVLAPIEHLNLIRAAQRIVDLTHDRRHAVARIQTLIRIHLIGEVGVRRDLPAAEVNRFQPGLDLLHSLVARHRAKRGDVRFRMQQTPKAFRAHLRERVTDLYGPAKAQHVFRGVRPHDTLPTVVVVPRFAQRLRLFAIDVVAFHALFECHRQFFHGLHDDCPPSVQLLVCP